ncbi:MAG: hypothetical protein NTW21_04195 [Verrucomicrobia bacterium]|nr:hypothetical protein [Verrucomicrobiota bacterium]
MKKTWIALLLSATASLAQSYETECMLRFYLDGIQYALGDLHCDDSPLK